MRGRAVTGAAVVEREHCVARGEGAEQRLGPACAWIAGAGDEDERDAAAPQLVGDRVAVHVDGSVGRVLDALEGSVERI